MGNEKNALLRQIGGKVAYYRKLRDLTQTALAERVNALEARNAELEAKASGQSAEGEPETV